MEIGMLTSSQAEELHSQVCQIFLETIYQNEGKIYQITTVLPSGRKLYQTAVKYYK
jgi:hypothetical protein